MKWTKVGDNYEAEGAGGRRYRLEPLKYPKMTIWHLKRYHPVERQWFLMPDAQSVRHHQLRVVKAEAERLEKEAAA